MAAQTTDLVVSDRRRSALIPARELNPEDISDQSISTIERATILRTPAAQEVSKALAEINGRPLGDRILVLPLPKDDRYGSILIPETSQEDQACGIVVAVGKGRYENGQIVAPEVIPGNFVVFSKYAARTVKVGTVEIFQITEADINFAAGGQ